MRTDIKQPKAEQPRIISYVIGFVLSIVLTCSAYIVVLIHTSKHNLWIIPHVALMPIIILLALIQLFVQLTFFLHLWSESKPRWNLIFFISTVGIILIVIVGSIWIMNHLNYNMTPQQINTYVQSQDGF